MDVADEIENSQDELMDSTLPYSTQTQDVHPGEGASGVRKAPCEGTSGVSKGGYQRPKTYKISKATQEEVLAIEQEKVDLLRDIRDTLHEMRDLMKEDPGPNAHPAPSSSLSYHEIVLPFGQL